MISRYYLFFEANTGNREECNVYHSDLVIAENEEQAKKKWIAVNVPDRYKENPEKWFNRFADFREMKPL